MCTCTIQNFIYTESWGGGRAAQNVKQGRSIVLEKRTVLMFQGVQGGFLLSWHWTVNRRVQICLQPRRGWPFIRECTVLMNIAGCRAQTDMWKLLPPPSAIIIWILQYHMANTNQHFASMDLKSWLSLLCVVCFRFHHHFDNIGLCLSNSTVTALCAEFPPTQQNAWAASFIVLIYWFFTPKICK